MPHFDSFDDFYPFYLSQHSKRGTRLMHFAGTALGAAIGIKALAIGPRREIIAAPIVSYGCAWLSHFLIEHNKPATWGEPLYSLRGDLTMLYEMARGRDAELQRIADEYLAAEIFTLDDDDTEAA